MFEQIHPMVKINFNIPGAVHTKIILYNILGKEVAVLIDDLLKPGEYDIDIDLVDLPSGTYFYKVISDGFKETKKVLMVK